MGNKIKLHRTLTAGNIPTSLEAGEIAIDTVLGRIFFANEVDAVTFLVQKIYVSASNVTPLSPMEESLWFKTDIQQLWIYLGTTWVPIGISELGGVFKGHISVKSTVSPYQTIFSTSNTGISTKDVICEGFSSTEGVLTKIPTSVAGSVNAISATFAQPFTLYNGLSVVFTPPGTNTSSSVSFQGNTGAIVPILGVVPGTFTEDKPAHIIYTGGNWHVASSAISGAPRSFVCTPQNMQAIVNIGNRLDLTFPHPLGVVPLSVMRYLVNVTPQYGYSAGQIVIPESTFATPGVLVTSTDVRIFTSASSGVSPAPGQAVYVIPRLDTVGSTGVGAFSPAWKLGVTVIG
jgi:hypothetical protein